MARFQGEQGESGLRGMPGAHGMPGEEGPRGPFGIDGCNGTNGASGFPGYPGSPGLFIIIIIFFPTICCLHRIFCLFVSYCYFYCCSCVVIISFFSAFLNVRVFILLDFHTFILHLNNF